MTSLLADPSERIRSFAVLAASEAKNRAALPVARELLESSDADVRLNAATAVARLADKLEVMELLGRPWGQQQEQGLRKIARERGLDLPQHP